jgi:hypothetical protein
MAVEVKSRRRPGRNNQVSPHLIPLLRNAATMDIPASLPDVADQSVSENDLAFAKGISLGLVLSAPLWAIIGAVVWMVIR